MRNVCERLARGIHYDVPPPRRSHPRVVFHGSTTPCTRARSSHSDLVFVPPGLGPVSFGIRDEGVR